MRIRNLVALAFLILGCNLVFAKPNCPNVINIQNAHFGIIPNSRYYFAKPDVEKFGTERNWVYYMYIPAKSLDEAEAKLKTSLKSLRLTRGPYWDLLGFCWNCEYATDENFYSEAHTI